MAQGTTQILLPATSFPGPTGVSASVDGDAKQAAAYYLANRDLQTISWNLGTEFTGDISIQASITTEPTLDSDWFTVYDLDITSGLVATQQGYNNLVGNYVWIRAIVRNWTLGSISLVAATY